MDTEERTRKYAAVEDTARLINTIQQSLSQRRGDDIPRIVPQEWLSRSLSNTSLNNEDSPASDKALVAVIE